MDGLTEIQEDPDVSFDFPPIGRPDPGGVQRPRPAAPSTGDGRFVRDLEAASARVDALPSMPPPEVLEAIDRAYEKVIELQMKKRELHFDPDPNTGRIRVEVRDDEGHVIRELPLVKALEIADGTEPVE